METESRMPSPNLIYFVIFLYSNLIHFHQIFDPLYIKESPYKLKNYNVFSYFVSESDGSISLKSRKISKCVREKEGDIMIFPIAGYWTFSGLSVILPDEIQKIRVLFYWVGC